MHQSKHLELKGGRLAYSNDLGWKGVLSILFAEFQFAEFQISIGLRLELGKGLGLGLWLGSGLAFGELKFGELKRNRWKCHPRLPII